MKKPSRVVVAMYGVCAVLWVIKVISAIVKQTIYVPGFWFVMEVLCAVVWITCFAVNLKRYLSGEEEEQ